MQTGPLVSVIATCYNHERYVEECLESIRNQTYENVQLIIVDDCSTDRSVRVIRSWLARTGTPATLITHRVNRGICRSRNDAHRRARGRYLSMIATDDTWVPDKLAIQVPMMESLPADVAVLYGDATTMDENSATRPEMVIDLYGYLDSFPDGWVFDHLLRGNFVTSLTALVRRRCIDAVGGYDEALIYEDWDLWLRLSRRYRFVFAPQVFGRYRILENSLVHALHGERRLDFFESSLRIARKNAGVSEASDARLRFRMNELGYALGALEHPGLVRLFDRLDRRPAWWVVWRGACVGPLGRVGARLQPAVRLARRAAVGLKPVRSHRR